MTKLKHFYEHSIELERIVPKLLSHLVGGRLNPTQHLETQQALVKQLAEILEFVLKFDEYKVKKQSNNNDFNDLLLQMFELRCAWQYLFGNSNFKCDFCLANCWVFVGCVSKAMN